MGTPRSGRKPTAVAAFDHDAFPAPAFASPDDDTLTQATRATPDTGISDASPDSGRVRQRMLAVTLRTWSDAGYGLWALQGLALAVGIYRHGRGESLVPLALGTLFVSAGLILACVRRPGLPPWHGWYPGRSAWPPREALMALAVYLPLLAVAGLTRGDNSFWATRVAGAVLTLCSVGMLYGSPRRAPGESARSPSRNSLAMDRLLAGLYGGGLWLWLCVAADRNRLGPAEAAHQPWLLILLVLALLLGLLEGMRWHVLRPGQGEGAARARSSLLGARFVAALLTYAVPCTALLLADRWQVSGWMALLAALCGVAGRSLEQRLHARASAASAPLAATV
ncbi:hypothetical protein [Dyella sp.]|jgi:hypothetical protein|uniref:hypothetical protein n=1 Tax=Dyella sp. TaxID=1869338 RepID=UPI002D789213|nr:hypothetical protein [Dyella sp.]HET6434017.1 hypothetical protein [Dyella sp.]